MTNGTAAPERAERPADAVHRDVGAKRETLSGLIPEARVKRWLEPLAGTPLHPQWLVLRHRRGTAAWIRAHAHGRLVDVGCGNGALRRELGGSVDYVGIDYPATVALGYTGTADIHADAARLPIATGSIDAVALLDVLEHLPRPELAVAEAARVLRPGGKCLIHVPFLYPLHDEPHDFQRWTRHGLARLLDAHGLELCEIEETTKAVDSAAALLAIALARGLLDAIRLRRPAALLAPALLALIPVVNLVGWALAACLPAARFMPFSYRVAARKRCARDAETT